VSCRCCTAVYCVVLQSRFQDSMLGRVQIPVADVARNGCLKDTWALLVSVGCGYVELVCVLGRLGVFVRGSMP
jgi:hypothetical protein